MTLNHRSTGLIRLPSIVVWLGIVVALGLVLLACSTRASGGRTARQTPTPTPTSGSPTLEVSIQTVSFTTGDGVRLGGKLFGAGKTGVILAHMFPADQESWKTFAQLLAQEGYMVLTFDFRGYPSSGGSRDISIIDRDMEAALAFMWSRGTSQVFLIGASMGGTAALKVAAREQVKGVVAFSAARSFAGIEVTDQELSRLTVPVLYLASQRDEPAAFAAQAMYDKTPSKAEIRTFSGGAHGSDLLRFGNAEEVEKLVLNFLKRYSQ